MSHYRFVDAHSVHRASAPKIGRMARGFESKQVESQQEEAARGRTPTGPELSVDERARLERERALKLSRKRAQNELNRASAPAHRRMLEQAIAALDAELQALIPEP
jgi:hypothetical protein